MFPVPAAATITIRDTLAMLDDPKREVAEGVANGRYIFWLGSGISRDKMPDLRKVAKKVMQELQARNNPADANCRYRQALTEIIELASPSPEERKHIDHTKDPKDWGGGIFDAFARRLTANYSKMLNVTVDKEVEDFLLWDILDLAKVYSDPNVDPDAEHLSLAALAVEGVTEEMPTANWDSLIERAIKKVAGGLDVLRVVVAPADAQKERKLANLYKFHGCAHAACADEPNFRELLVGRSSQINRWIVSNPLMSNILINLIATRPTLMLGLSVQDANIQHLFAAAEAQLAWVFPSNPPAYAFAEDSLGADQNGLLQNVYHQDFSAANRAQITADALIRAYAKPLLLSLLLYVLIAKLKLLVQRVVPGFADADREKLEEGLLEGRNEIADALKPQADIVLELLAAIGRAITMLKDGALPGAGDGIYRAVTSKSVNQMANDPDLQASGMCEFAVASGLIGLGLKRAMWTAQKPNLGDDQSGSFTLVGRSGPAKVYFAANSNAAVRLVRNGLVGNDDAVIVHSHAKPEAMARSPRFSLRSGLALVREVSISELMENGTEIEDLLTRFGNEAAL
jgi:hypothetical protein